MNLVPPTYVMVRLGRWAVWCMWCEDLFTRSPIPQRTKSWWHPMIMRSRVHDPCKRNLVIERPCPVDVLEAEETEACVQALPEKLRAVIVLEYLTNMTKLERAASMKPPGCAKTYYNRLDHAHYQMLGLMNDAGAGLPLAEPINISAAA